MKTRAARRSIPALSLIFLSAAAMATAQQPGFPERPALTLRTPSFTDADVADLLLTLDGLLAPPVSPAEARNSLWNFGRQLQRGELNRQQEERVLAHLERLSRERVEIAPMVAGARDMVSRLTIGKTAPEIIGRDLNGNEMRLSSFRGKVVVLLFSADWCGICRTQHPYERLMQELYRNWPFAILSVEAGTSPETTQQAKARAGLTYRSWWDGANEEGNGPIASAWNVGGFPTTYVIDPYGVIRFVDIRHEDLLKGVRQLLTEHVDALDRQAARAPVARAAN